MITTKQYVTKFGLSDHNQKHFNREEFLQVLGEEFKERLSHNQLACKKFQAEFTYSKFLHTVKEIQDKFQAISNKKAGEPFTEQLFNAFYAIHVVPQRESLFPEEHQKIQDARKEKEARLTKRAEQAEIRGKQLENLASVLMGGGIRYDIKRNHDGKLYDASNKKERFHKKGAKTFRK